MVCGEGEREREERKEGHQARDESATKFLTMDLLRLSLKLLNILGKVGLKDWAP
jgi:hypothetical protein